MKVCDSRKALVADKRGVNSSVSKPLQGVGMIDRQRLKGYKTREVDITELCRARNELNCMCSGSTVTVTKRALQKLAYLKTIR